MQPNLTIWAIVATVTAALIWANYAILPSSSISYGEVTPQVGLVNVMHQQGGTVAELFVKDGTSVRKGDPIVALEPFEQEVDQSTIHRRLEEMMATIARLEAERDGTEVKDKVSYRGEKMIIRATIDGTIKMLNVHVGEVVQSDTIIAIIVPVGYVFIQAKLKVSEVGYVYEGQNVNVMISGSESSRFEPIHGTVQSISADTFQNEDGGIYYQVTIAIESDRFVHKSNPQVTYPLMVGMQVQNMILTGEQTVLEYIVSPLLSMTSYAMVER